ncbi:MAG: hypothetical protein D4S01_06405 [Dehalococcoidia bacterium]|nr:MAG: hypothetical protein D4S01_06405 [Dehalococcoidia bacterium]
MSSIKASEIYYQNKTRIDENFNEAERIHYFGLCQPDHSDCPLPRCAIREGLLPPQRPMPEKNCPKPEEHSSILKKVRRLLKLNRSS